MSRNVFQGEPDDENKEVELAKIDLAEELEGWPEEPVPYADLLEKWPAMEFKNKVDAGFLEETDMEKLKKALVDAHDETGFKARGTSVAEHRRKQHETLQELYNEENKAAEERLQRTPPKPYQASRVCSCTGDAHVKGTRPSCPPNV